MSVDNCKKCGNQLIFKIGPNFMGCYKCPTIETQEPDKEFLDRVRIRLLRIELISKQYEMGLVSREEYLKTLESINYE